MKLSVNIEFPDKYVELDVPLIDCINRAVKYGDATIDPVTSAHLQGWILVSEKLPDRSGEYLVCTKWGSVNMYRFSLEDIGFGLSIKDIKMDAAA